MIPHVATSWLRTVTIAGLIIGEILFVLLVLVCLTAIAAVILIKRKSKAYKCIHINFLNKLNPQEQMIWTKMCYWTH